MAKRVPLPLTAVTQLTVMVTRPGMLVLSMLTDGALQVLTTEPPGTDTPPPGTFTIDESYVKDTARAARFETVPMLISTVPAPSIVAVGKLTGTAAAAEAVSVVTSNAIKAPALVRGIVSPPLDRCVKRRNCLPTVCSHEGIPHFFREKSQ